MALGNIPVVSALPSIVTIYNLAPWLWDAAIICTILGLFFREGFDKIKMQKKLGGIFGFSMGLIVVIGMYVKGWQLIDLFPWLLLLLIFFGVILLRKWLIEHFGEEYATHATVGAIIAAFLAIGLLLGSTPWMGAIFGGWAGLIILFAFWAGILGLLVWAFWRLQSAIRGRGGGGGGSWWGGGGNGGGDDGGGYEEGGGGGPRGKRRGIWSRLFGRKKAPKPDNAAKDIEGAAGKTEGESEKSNKQADEAGVVIDAAKEIAEKLKKLLDAIKTESISIEEKIAGANQAARQKYADNIKGFADILKKVYAEFKEKKIIDEFAKVQDSFTRLGTLLVSLIERIRTLIQSLKNNIAPKIMRVNIPALKAEFTEEYRKHMQELAGKDTEVRAAYTRFQEDFKEAAKHADIPAITALIAELEKAEDKIRTMLLQTYGMINSLLRLPAADADAGIAQTRRNCAEITRQAELMSEKLNTFLQSDSAMLKAALDAMKKSNSQNIKIMVVKVIRQMAGLAPKIAALNAKVDAQLAKQAESEKQKEAEVSDIKKIIATVDLQTQKLVQLFLHVETFIRSLYGVFKQELTNEEIANLSGNIEVAAKDIAARFDLNAAAKVEPLLGKDVVNAKEDISRRIALCKALCQAEVKELEDAKATVKTIIAEITTAANHLETRVSNDLGITADKKAKMQALLKKLQEFLADEEKIQKMLEIISGYDQYILSSFEEKIKLVVLQGRKNISLEVKTRTDALLREVAELRRTVQKLRRDVSVLGAIEREEITQPRT